MASLNEYQALGAAPSVSNDQWKKHAVKKLSTGSLLIINPGRKFSRFYKGNGDLENCSFPVARRLLKEGYLEEVGTHITGTIYQLSENFNHQASLAKISQSQMGAMQLIEDDEDETDTDEFGFEASDDVYDESLESDEGEGDNNAMAV